MTTKVKRKNVDNSSIQPDKGKKRKKITEKADGEPTQPVIEVHSKGNEAVPGQQNEIWMKYKKEKKELRLKRKQAKTGFEVITKAKQIGEKLRCKSLKGGDTERQDLIDELHSLLRPDNNYSKFVLAHDTSRVVQWLLKYSSDRMKEQISKELVPHCIEMLQSKYGVFCVKRLLKYGSTNTRKEIVDKFYGHVVKLSSHAFSAPIFEYSYANWATPTQKRHLIQEFYGELYKNNKDDSIKHLVDVYKNIPNLKRATLNAVKANLIKVINKNLLDSTLVHSVLSQFFSEASVDDRNELISSLIPHIVILSNSKDGASVGMQCLWQCTLKDKKKAMKTIKEHVIEMAKHEHGHSVLLALIDCADDTVLLDKMLIRPVLRNVKVLAENEWGRKVLVWLIAPNDSTFFHPKFVQDLETGRNASNAKKEAEARRQEIKEFAINKLLNTVAEEPSFWLQNASKAYELLTIIKSGAGEALRNALKQVTSVVVDPNWEVQDGDKRIKGVEHSGLHMFLKKLSMNDKHVEIEEDKFGPVLVDQLNEEILSSWLALNRGCFLLVFIFENSSDELQTALKEKLRPHLKQLEKADSVGGKLLLKKIKS